MFRQISIISDHDQLSRSILFVKSIVCISEFNCVHGNDIDIFSKCVLQVRSFSVHTIWYMPIRYYVGSIFFSHLLNYSLSWSHHFGFISMSSFIRFLVKLKQSSNSHQSFKRQTVVETNQSEESNFRGRSLFFSAQDVSKWVPSWAKFSGQNW